LLSLINPRIDRAIEGSGAFWHLWHHGDIDVVQLLLTDPGIDPGVEDNTAFQLVCFAGNADVEALRCARWVDCLVDCTKQQVVEWHQARSCE
jgi:hypothetical protein